MKTYALFACIALAGLGQPARVMAQHTVTVKIPKLKEPKGHLHVFLCNDSKAFYDKAVQTRVMPVNPQGETKIVFANVPKGAYAIRVFQDLNNSHALDRSMMDIPEEPVGFSNNPPVNMGPPDFESARFEVNTSVEHKILLHSFKYTLF